MDDRPWYAPRGADEIVPVPWLHPSATAYLESLLRPDMRVLEHGAGGSTLWFAERVKKVVTFEHDQRWIDKIMALAPVNVTVYIDYYTSILKVPTYDLFFIDGAREGRGFCLDTAHLKVKPGGYVVLDNANRPEYAAERKAFAEHATLLARFDNNIPQSKYFITEFWKLCASE
jgi:predicted O-methyltransferase YrrM